jgi:circadian clock protein KaiB
MRKSPTLSAEAETMRAILAANATAHYRLRLYVTGSTGSSRQAIINIRKICEEHLDSRHDLEVVDIAQHPELASDAQIIAAPTLIRYLPLPVRRFIGDLSRTDRVLAGLDLQPAPATLSPARNN